jgi:hypothetical protein
MGDHVIDVIDVEHSTSTVRFAEKTHNNMKSEHVHAHGEAVTV